MYCNRCKHLNEGSICVHCGNRQLHAVKPENEVFVISLGSEFAGMFANVLMQQKIQFTTQLEKGLASILGTAMDRVQFFVKYAEIESATLIIEEMFGGKANTSVEDDGFVELDDIANLNQEESNEPQYYETQASEEYLEDVCIALEDELACIRECKKKMQNLLSNTANLQELSDKYHDALEVIYPENCTEQDKSVPQFLHDIEQRYKQILDLLEQCDKQIRDAFDFIG